MLLRGETIFPIYLGMMLFVLVYGSALIYVLNPSRAVPVFLAGFALDNAVILSAWWIFLALHQGAVQTNDMYLAIVPFIMLGIARLGWLIGGFYAAFWIAWLALTSSYFYGDGSYDIQQLPVRVIFISTIAVVAMRFVAVIARERRLERTRIEELERLERFKSSVVQSISHELRTPVTTIKLSASLLKERSLRSGRWDDERLLRSLENATARLERIVEQSTEFGYIQDSNNSLHLQSTDLISLVRSTVEMMSAELEAKQQSVEFFLPEELASVDIDRVHIERTVSMLVDNAIKYSPIGSRISVRVADHGSRISVGVSDNGPGIPLEDQQYLFTGFYRGSKGDRLPVPGAGLSLALAKQLVERHGGHIGIRSREGSGTTVYFVLPRSGTRVAAADRDRLPAVDPD
ncbi:MAG: HAMP domain-containing histidine kinase [Chloroflexi bacterium]|nr:HAMP domain-containing histidine kinase [Chloroflexota bacterium]